MEVEDSLFGRFLILKVLLSFRGKTILATDREVVCSKFKSACTCVCAIPASRWHSWWSCTTLWSESPSLIAAGTRCPSLSSTATHTFSWAAHNDHWWGHWKWSYWTNYNGLMDFYFFINKKNQQIGFWWHDSSASLQWSHIQQWRECFLWKTNFKLLPLLHYTSLNRD